MSEGSNVEISDVRRSLDDSMSGIVGVVAELQRLRIEGRHQTKVEYA